MKIFSVQSKLTTLFFTISPYLGKITPYVMLISIEIHSLKICLDVCAYRIFEINAFNKLIILINFHFILCIYHSHIQLSERSLSSSLLIFHSTLLLSFIFFDVTEKTGL